MGTGAASSPFFYPETGRENRDSNKMKHLCRKNLKHKKRIETLRNKCNKSVRNVSNIWDKWNGF